MGLPLYIAPVESDVPSRPPAKSTGDPANVRSPIRRTERRRQVIENREQRLRMLAALHASDDSSSFVPPTTRPISRPADPRRLSERQSPRLENPRISELARHIDLDRPSEYGRPSTGDFGSFGLNDDEWEVLDRIMPPQREATAQSSATTPIHTRPPRFVFGYVPSTASERQALRHERDQVVEARRRRRDQLERQSQIERLISQPTSISSAAAHRHAQRVAQQVRYYDGLGDRDRSLSPEGDGVWDTLQSTLTPDPQPPSVGSSFASTTVSATTSQTNGTNSVNTSMTTPDEETEPPCDPIIDNSGSDGEDDVEEQSNELSRQPASRGQPRSQRSYADVAAEPQSRQSPEPADANEVDRLEWLSGMHRIVRGLASREDIPDEWWAQAGLSRSMSWEDPN
ncbi:hypothetical protein HD806DRAFT_532463 [Xylariaceae sp. AK1471]|nr:hypothetical protein HD806DRAFT_532463 [Xylariaceae sp. AK1471]